jgi:hypothetical protein
LHQMEFGGKPVNSLVPCSYAGPNGTDPARPQLKPAKTVAARQLA